MYYDGHMFEPRTMLSIDLQMRDGHFFFLAHKIWTVKLLPYTLHVSGSGWH